MTAIVDTICTMRQLPVELREDLRRALLAFEPRRDIGLPFAVFHSYAKVLIGDIGLDPRDVSCASGKDKNNGEKGNALQLKLLPVPSGA